MYWTEQYGNNFGIVSGRMDGTQLIPLRKKDLNHPTAIAIDVNSQRLFWVDAFRKDIEHSRVNGDIYEIFKPRFHQQFKPQHLVVQRGKLYWSVQAGELGAIFGVNTVINNRAERYVEGGNFTDRISGMCFYDASGRVGEIRENPCTNQSCPGVCLISGEGSVRCVCPIGTSGSACHGMLQIQVTENVNLTT